MSRVLIILRLDLFSKSSEDDVCISSQIIIVTLKQTRMSRDVGKLRHVKIVAFGCFLFQYFCLLHELLCCIAAIEMIL